MEKQNSSTGKLLTVAVPCYNSEAYMRHCIDSILPGGSEVELLIVDDGSTDGTLAVAQEYAARYPDIVTVIHQENAGHGGAVMTALRAARGLYFRVVDSDDWLDSDAFGELLAALTAHPDTDMFATNYIYDKAGARHKKVMRCACSFPAGRVIGWAEMNRPRTGHYMMMHSITYRTEVLRRSGLVLPEHTFYVDSLYAYVPLQTVKTVCYLDLDLYHYFIGREGQSVQERVLIQRVDQQIAVLRLMLEQVRLSTVEPEYLRKYMFNYLEVICAIASVLLILADTEESLGKLDALWDELSRGDEWTWQHLHAGWVGCLFRRRGPLARKTGVVIYRIARKLFGFN